SRERFQVPTARFGNEKYPRASVTVLNSVRMEELVIVTIAPGITPPVESLIVPEMLPPTAANAAVARKIMMNPGREAFATLNNKPFCLPKATQNIEYPQDKSGIKIP